MIVDVLRGVALGVVLVALAALASACVDLPPGVGSREHPESERRRTVELTIEAWEAELGPVGGDCRSQLHELRVAVLAEPTFVSACGYCALIPGEPCEETRRRRWAEEGRDVCRYGCASSCSRHASGTRGMGREGRRIPILVSTPADDRRLHRRLVHEAIHWLGDCTDRGEDPRHVDRVLWGDPVGSGGIQRAATERVEGRTIRKRLPACGGPRGEDQVDGQRASNSEDVGSTPAAPAE